MFADGLSVVVLHGGLVLLVAWLLCLSVACVCCLVIAVFGLVFVVDAG